MVMIIMGKVRNLVMFYQVNGKKLRDKNLEIVEINLWIW